MICTVCVPDCSVGFYLKNNVNLFIMLCLESTGNDHVISELCYERTILQFFKGIIGK